MVSEGGFFFIAKSIFRMGFFKLAAENVIGTETVDSCSSFTVSVVFLHGTKAHWEKI